MDSTRQRANPGQDKSGVGWLLELDLQMNDLVILAQRPEGTTHVDGLANRHPSRYPILAPVLRKLVVGT